jgi:hypothetical protein
LQEYEGGGAKEISRVCGICCHEQRKRRKYNVWSADWINDTKRIQNWNQIFNDFNCAAADCGRQMFWRARFQMEQLLICGGTKRSHLKALDEEEELELAEEELENGDNLPEVSESVMNVIKEVRKSLSGATKFNRLQYIQRADEHRGIACMMELVNKLESCFRERAARPKWKGYNWIPQRRKQWRLSISSSDLQGSIFFSRSCVANSLRRIHRRLHGWMDVLQSCACFNTGYSFEQTFNFVVPDKEFAFKKMWNVLETSRDTNGQILSDGVSLKLRYEKDRSVAVRERLDWKQAPLQVMGISRVCGALDRVLDIHECGFTKKLEEVVENRRRLYNKKEREVERVFDLEAVWKNVQKWAADSGYSIQDAFAKVLTNDECNNDLLAKSKLFGEIPAYIASSLLNEDTLQSTTTCSFDFGLCKWIGGVVALPGADNGMRLLSAI